MTMARSGQNGGGKGGRNYRVNWSEGKTYAFGNYLVEDVTFAGSPRPWVVRFKRMVVARAEGRSRGARRFVSAERAMRWVEKLLRDKP